MKLPSYVAVSRHGVFYFRVRIPQDLRERFPHSQIRRSLKTTDRRIAIERARECALQVSAVFRKARNTLEYQVDYSAHGLGVHLLKYNPQNPVELEEANKRIAEMQSIGTGAIRPVTTAASPTLSSVIDAFMAEVAATKKPATVEKYKHSLGLLKDLVGDPPISSVTQATFGKFKGQIAKLPLHLTKNPDTKGKSASDLVKQEHTQCISARTVNTHLRNVVSLMRWAKAHYDGVQSITSDKLAISIKARADEERAAFTDAELAAMFLGPRFDSLPDHKKWLLRLGLYTGARIEELCQLDLATDVYQESGVWVFDFNDSGDKALKTKASRRKIPVHPRLIELGLLDYLDRLKNAGHRNPFPEWPTYRGKRSKNASRWFGRYCDTCGIKDQKKVFHSLRHGALDRMKQAGVDEGIAAAVAGQCHGGITYNRYGKAYAPSMLVDAVATIRFPTIES